MARRSAQNPRYQKDKLGTTRKSAASAKPKRSSGETGSSSTSSKSSSGEKPKSRFFKPLPVPETPAYKRWRQIWFGLLIGAVVFSIVAFLQQGTQVGPTVLIAGNEVGVQDVALVAAYACIISAVYIDVTKIRRMRKELADELDAKGSKKKKSGSK